MTRILASARLIGLIVGAPLLLAGCDFFASPETRLERAEAQIEAGDFRLATIELKNVLQEQPENGRAWQRLAQASLELGDAQSAERELSRAVDAGIPAAEIGELAARVYLALAQFDRLLTGIDAGEIAVAEPLLSLYRGQALQGLRRFPEAEQVLSGLLDKVPGDAAARIALAEVFAAQGNVDGALQELGRVTDDHPQAALAWLIRGVLIARRGQFDEAIRLLEQAKAGAKGELTVQQYVVLLGTLVEARLATGAVVEAERAHQELSALSSSAPLTRFLGARIAIVRQDYSAAAAGLQRLVTASPDFLAARFLLGAVLLAQNNLQQAHLQLSQVVQSAPDNLEARKLLARVNLRLNHPDAAMQVLTPALQAESADPQLNALFGTAQLQTGDDAGAIERFERTLAGNPDDLGTRIELAAAYIRLGDAARALPLLRGASTGPMDVRVASLTLAALLATEGLAASDAELQRLLKLAPRDLSLLNLGGGYYARQGQFDRARGLLTQALAVAPDNVETMLNSAQVELTAGNFDVAGGWLERVLATQPDNTPAILGLAELASRRGDLQSAVQQLEKARDKLAQAIEPRLRLAHLYLQLNRADDARATLDEALSIAPDKAVAHNAAGLIFNDSGRYDEAIAQFRAAADANPRHPGYWLNLGRAQLALNQTGAARESVNRALALQPDWIPAAGTAALMDVRDGRQDAAQTRIRGLRQKRPRDPEVLILQGDVNMAVKSYEAAFNAYAAATKLRPEAATALKAYRARHLGQLGQATAPLTEWLALTPGDIGVRSVLAEAYLMGGQRERAIAEYEAVIASGLATSASFNNLAWLYHQNGDGRALPTALNAYKLAPQAPAVLDTYGWILVEAGQVSEGLKLLDAARQALPNDAEVGYHYAAALARAGERRAARTHVERLLTQHSAFQSRAAALDLLTQLGGG